MTGHDGRPRPDHDWRVASRCAKCGGPVVEMRIGGRYGRQAEHRPDCRAVRVTGFNPLFGAPYGKAER